MKLAIISDVHANLEALQATLQNITVDHVDHIVCFGDIVGYNANPAECIAELRKLNALCVTGNHDRAVCGDITTDGFSPQGSRMRFRTLT
jgi:predicted phosphodiesterase